MRDSYLQPAKNEPVQQDPRARTPKRQTTCVSSTVVNAAPQCASSCIEAFVSNNYGSASCSDRQSLDFLCTHNSGAGLTIGEAGLQCIISNCSSQDLTQLGVYSICSGITGAISETVRTFTATLGSAGSSASFSTTAGSPASATDSSTSHLLSSIDIPTSLSSVASLATASASTLVSSSSATGTQPTTVATSATSSAYPSKPTAFSSSTAVPSSQSTSTVTHHHSSGLTNAQIAGVSVAGFASVSLAFALLSWLLCLRKRQRTRRRSQRWSFDGDGPIPAGGGQPTPSTPSATDQMPSDFNLHQRYYAPPPVEQRRRSFWRRSIKPEEIGVAVSPEVVQQTSPTSISSARTISRLLPVLPQASLWPAPLRIDTPAKQAYPHPSQPPATTEEEEAPNMSSLQDLVENTRREIAVENVPREPEPARATESRLYLYPRTKNLPIENARNARKSARIPLTPTYDNGNFGPGLQLTNLSAMQPGGYGRDGGPSVPQPSSAQNGYWSASQRIGRPGSAQESRLLQRPTRDQSRMPPSALRNPTRRSKLQITKSTGSDTTFIEEDSTPEQEIDNQLGGVPVSSQSSRYNHEAAEERSPIKDLSYPRVPRTAAMSRQAEKTPQPRRSPDVGTSRPIHFPTSRRDMLVRDEPNFVYGDSNSPERYPGIYPAALGQLGAKPDDAGLRIRTASNTNQMSNMRFEGDAPDDVFVDRSQQAESMDAKQTPTLPLAPLQTRLTPNRTREGDLYLTVED